MSGGPLSGVSFATAPGDDARISVRVAHDTLRRLGARPTPLGDRATDVIVGTEDVAGSRSAPLARLDGPAPVDVAGLPPATISYATGLGLAGAALVALLSHADHVIHTREVERHVMLPLALATELGTTHREPPAPRPIGRGHVACDLAGDEDEAAFARVLTSLGTQAEDPVAVADEAQAWRLPVCAFLPRRANGVAVLGTGDTGIDTDSRPWQPRVTTGPPLAGVTVCDLTAMWAGPLATALLAGLGAEVHKINSSIRPDGMNAPGMANALNHGKHQHDLDLRDPDHRQRFDVLVHDSDVVIDSFSRRVMPNLGYSPTELRRLHPGVATVSMPAFPAEHPWQVALGPGVHAASGLGTLGRDRVAAPVVAYPDPLAGLRAFVEVLAALIARACGDSPAHREVSLFGAVTPLLDLSDPGDLVAQRDPGLGRRVLDGAGAESARTLVGR